MLKISGVGARIALAVLSGLSVGELIDAVTLQETGRLVKIPGIGKKTAEKIVLELKDKTAQLGAVLSTPDGDDGALAALRAMGYSQSEAREALARVPDSVAGESARLKAALRSLS